MTHVLHLSHCAEVIVKKQISPTLTMTGLWSGRGLEQSCYFKYSKKSILLVHCTLAKFVDGVDVSTRSTEQLDTLSAVVHCGNDQRCGVVLLLAKSKCIGHGISHPENTLPVFIQSILEFQSENT